jgi:predicted Fe-Mo cluster-binding NifX family protein
VTCFKPAGIPGRELVSVTLTIDELEAVRLADLVQHPGKRPRTRENGRRKMRMCVPVQENKGLESVAFGHFGSAPFFIIHDTDTGKTVAVENGNRHHAHGSCHPMEAVGGESVDAIIVGGIGMRAIGGLNAAGIRVYRSVEGTVQSNIDAYRRGALVEITPESACGHHGHGNGCGH